MILFMSQPGRLFKKTVLSGQEKNPWNIFLFESEQGKISESISLPSASERDKRSVIISWSGILSTVLAIELVFTLMYGSGSSPLYAYFTLGQEMREVSELRSSISESSEDMTMHFWDYANYDFREKPEKLPEKPNVILILTEELSNNIIDDERNIMPNVASYREKSLSFARYYNHTFATYRGIIGQLYSGYQLENYDTNSLVFVQEAFRKNGYHTSVINTEPTNVNFAMYLESMKFDEVVTNTDLMAEGTAKTLSDKQAYEVLFDEVSEKYSEGVSFMTTIYTFGTHVSLDSPDAKFGDGSDRLLNKFYNLDCQFGSFMNKLEESGITEDTIVVFTADHCTYADSDFVNAFPDIHRAHTECGQMPLFIYYKGVAPEEIDVNGRNSLDLAPTLLDYLDIHVGNYFLGFTLFADDHTSANMTSFDRIFSDSAVHVSSAAACFRRHCERELSENYE